MAIAFHSAQGPRSETLGTVIPDYLRAAEAGDVPDPNGRMYSATALRGLRRTLADVDAILGDVALTHIHAADDVALESLAWRVIDRGGLPPSRLGTIIDALRRLSAWAEPGPRAGWRPQAEHAPDPSPSPPSPRTLSRAARTPTFTMLALGEHVGVWIERIIVIAFVLTAIGLALEFA
jgi:hypothetical protein